MKRNSIGTCSVIKKYLVFICIFFPFSLFANNEWFESYNNTRSLSMGGASVAITSDETSLYRNAANLGSIRDTYGTLIDPEIEGSSNFVSQVTCLTYSIVKIRFLQQISELLYSHFLL